MVDSHRRNIPVKLFQNLSTDLAEEVVKSLFLFIALGGGGGWSGGAKVLC